MSSSKQEEKLKEDQRLKGNWSRQHLTVNAVPCLAWVCVLPLPWLGTHEATSFLYGSHQSLPTLLIGSCEDGATPKLSHGEPRKTPP